MIDIFIDRLNSAGNAAGVFEADEDVGYFYLYRLNDRPEERISGAVQILSGAPDFSASDVDVRWFDGDTKVGLFIKTMLWAYFEVASGRGVSGRYPEKPLPWSLQ